MGESKVFYSWQSDLPNSTNRGFIQKALENAAKAIRVDDSIKVEPVIDRDTAGVPGAPDIASTIFAKIEEAQVFACDVSIINEGEKSRPTPNPNVLIELGYAIKTLGSERILMIMNTAFGIPELLPFDLSKKRVVTYNMPEAQQDRAPERKILETKLESGLRSILAQTKASMSDESPADRLKKYLVDDKYRIQLDELMKDETRKLAAQMHELTYEFQSNPLMSQIDLLAKFQDTTVTLRDLLAIGCYFGDRKHGQLWQKTLEQIANIELTTNHQSERYVALILLYSAGISAMLANNYHSLMSLLIEAQCNVGSEKYPLVLEISAWDTMDVVLAHKLLGHEDNITPLSEHLMEILKDPLSEITTSPSSYEECFDRFEYFFALVRADMAQSIDRSVNFAVGRFVWKHLVRIRENKVFKSGVAKDVDVEAHNAGNSWPPLQAGFFGGQIGKFARIKNQFDRSLEKLYFQLCFP